MQQATRQIITDCMDSVKSFNDILGNLNKPVNSELEYNMMKEEVLEYFEATVNKEPHLKEKGQLDSLADQFVVWWGTVLKHGWEDKIAKVLLAVCNSNMTKFCNTQEEAEESVLAYTKKGIATRWEYNERHQVYVIFNMDGKGMKGINYTPPQF